MSLDPTTLRVLAHEHEHEVRELDALIERWKKMGPNEGAEAAIVGASWARNVHRSRVRSYRNRATRIESAAAIVRANLGAREAAAA